MRVTIIGSGISGLSTAHALTRAGHHVDVFEREGDVGGLVATCDLDGTRIEKYYHFLCGGDDGYFDLCRDLGLTDALRFHHSRTGFFYEGARYRFTTPLDLLRFAPIPLTQRIRFGMLALEARLRKEWRQLDALTAKPWLIDRIGLRAYEVIWEPLLALKFGGYHERISAAWVWHRLHRVARSKGKMGYLEGGTGLLLDTLVEQIRKQSGTIHTSCTVTRIVAEKGRVCAVELANGDTHACDHVISTLPLSLTAGLLPHEYETYAERLQQVQYIGVVCVLFKLARRVSKCFWLNVNDQRVPLNGIIEYTNLNPIDKNAGHIAYVPYYVATDNPLYSSSDEAIIEQSWNALRLITPALRDEDLIAHRVFRSPHAQAICPTDFLHSLPESEAPITGLHLLDSTFLYPEDRTQSGLILRARECAERIGA